MLFLERAAGAERAGGIEADPALVEQAAAVLGKDTMRGFDGALAKAVGFSYNYNEARGEYVHPAAITLLSPEGKVEYILKHANCIGRSVEVIIRSLQALQSGAPTRSTWTGAAVIFHQVALFGSVGWSDSLVPTAFMTLSATAVAMTYATGLLLGMELIKSTHS